MPTMRIAAALGLLFAIGLGVLAIAEVSALQPNGEALSGAVGKLYGRTHLMALVMLAFVAIGSLCAFTITALRR
jgi:hypothetical protein